MRHFRLGKVALLDAASPAAASGRSRAVSLPAGRILAFAAYGLALSIVMAAFLHSDLQINSFVANAVAFGHWNVYRYFSSTPDLRGIQTVMPPLFYVVTGAWLAFLRLLHLDPVPVDPRVLTTQVFGQARGAAVLAGAALMKVPNAAALVLGAVWLGRLARRLGLRPESARILWLTCPILLAESFMQAQLDIMPAAVTAAALLVLDEERPWWTFVLLGVAAGFKNYPLLFVLPTALLLCRRDLRRAALYCAAGVLPFLAVLAPWASRAMVERIFLAHDGSSLFLSVALGPVRMHLWLLVYAGLCYAAWRVGRDHHDLRATALTWLTVACSIFVLSYWLPQWVAWIVPATTLFAAGDARFFRLWTAQNLFLLLNNLVAFGHNLDGALLTTAAGRGPLWTYLGVVGAHGESLIYTLTMVGFALLVYRGVQIVRSPGEADPPRAPLWHGAPTLAYVAGMLLQLI